MKRIFSYFLFLPILFASCENKKIDDKKESTTMTDSSNFKSGYSEVNGIKMYYEIYGQGEPLVLIHGGGSTISSSFGRIIPKLAENYTVIAMELQNHGRSGFRDDPQTFEQDADDVAVLVKNLGIKNASFLGFSNGGTTAMLVGMQHPELVNKLVLIAAAYKRSGLVPGFFEGMSKVTIAQMPQDLKDAFLQVNPDSTKLQKMFDKDRERMIEFEDWSDAQLKTIKAPTLIINGDKDVIVPEHALAMYHNIANSELAIIPGGHGKCIGEITTLADGNKDIDFVVPMIKAFLDKK